MTGDKVILTYKRKKPPLWIAYKRRRISSRQISCQENGCPDKYYAPTIAEKRESTEGNDSEYPRKISANILSRCMGYNIFKLVPEENGHLTDAIKQQDCLVSAKKASREDKNQDLHDMMPLAAVSLAVLDGSPGEDMSQEASADHCCLDLREQQKSNSIRESSYSYLLPEESGHLTGAIKQQDCMVSAEKASREEDKNLDLHDMMQLAAVSLAMLDGSRGEDISQKASVDHCSLDLHEQPKSNSVWESSYSYLNSSSTSDNKSLEKCSVPLIASCSIAVEPHDLSLEGNCNNDCIVACASEKETGLPVQDKSISLLKKATVQSKLNSPLITFCRRVKRMKEASKLPIQNLLLVRNDGSLVSDTAKEATLSKCNSEHDFIASRDVESSCAGAGSSSGSGNVKQGDGKLKNPSHENPSPVEVVPQVTEKNISSLDKNADLRLSEDPASCGNSSNDATVDKVTEILPHDDLSSIRGIIEVPTSRGSVMSLDPSVSLPVDSDIRSVHDGQPHRASPDPHSENHTTHLNDESPRNRVLELLHDRIGEMDSFANSSPVGTLRNSYLQLFPEVKNDDLFLSTKMQQKVQACANSENRIPLENSSQARTAAANSSLFLGLFLPIEVINDGHDHSSTSAQWLNVGVQSKEYLQDTLSHGFPDHPSSSVRHKMVLDSIASRARTRTSNQNQGSCVNLYGYRTTIWSEEELDSLWIGVRRYGRGNWNIMLRDPRLDFSPWRTPKDLAQQWEEEQLKLFNTTPLSQGMHSRTSNVFPDFKDGFWHPMMGRQSLMDDVQLSLGDVYSKPRDSVHKRPSFSFMDIQNNVPRHHEQPITSTRTTYSYRGSRWRAMFPKNEMMDAECSFGGNGSTCMPMGRNLPHWLKELVSIPLRPPRAAFPSEISPIGPVKVHCSDKPCLNDRGFDHKPRNTISNKNTVQGVELQIGAGSQDNREHGKPKQDQHPANKQDSIIIESDASSEETISDDRSTRV